MIRDTRHEPFLKAFALERALRLTEVYSMIRDTQHESFLRAFALGWYLPRPIRFVLEQCDRLAIAYLERRYVISTKPASSVVEVEDRSGGECAP